MSRPDIEGWREALLRIAFPQESGVDELAGNPNKWSATIAYKALGGRFDAGVRLDTKESLATTSDPNHRRPLTTMSTNPESE